MAPANAKSQDGVLSYDELVEAIPEFGETFAQAGVLVAAEDSAPILKAHASPGRRASPP
jgi:hypothetical protein